MVSLVVRACEITPVISSNPLLKGALNYRGKFIPVYDLIPGIYGKSNTLKSTDYFLIVKFKDNIEGCVLVTTITGVKEIEIEIQEDEKLFAADGKYFSGVKKIGDENYLITSFDEVVKAGDLDAIENVAGK